jgi:hypothetical protein
MLVSTFVQDRRARNDLWIESEGALLWGCWKPSSQLRYRQRCLWCVQQFPHIIFYHKSRLLRAIMYTTNSSFLAALCDIYVLLGLLSTIFSDSVACRFLHSYFSTFVMGCSNIFNLMWLDDVPLNLKPDTLAWFFHSRHANIWWRWQVVWYKDVMSNNQIVNRANSSQWLPINHIKITYRVVPFEAKYVYSTVCT